MFVMKGLLTRTLSGIIYIGIILGSIFLGTEVFSLFVVILAILGSIEFTKITQGLSKERMWTTVVDVATTVFVAGGGVCTYSLYVALLLFLVRFISTLYSKQENPLRSLSYSMLTIAYIGLPLALMSDMYVGFEGLLITLAMFVFIWINDTGAFIVGCSIGKHRLFERVSPKKSWEGFFGGLLFNIIVAIVCGYSHSSDSLLIGNIAFWLGFAVVVTVFATWGDLVESLIKRTLHLKDSGNMIPGHGGILDRIDSLLLVSPAIYIYITIFLCLGF